MFPFSVILFDKFQHSCALFSKSGFVSVHSRFIGLDTPVKPHQIHCFQTDQGHHFDNSLTRRFFKPVKTKT